MTKLLKKRNVYIHIEILKVTGNDKLEFWQDGEHTNSSESLSIELLCCQTSDVILFFT